MAEPATSAPPSLSEARDWIGHQIDDADGIGTGQVQGLFVDTGSGEPTWLIVKQGGRFGGSLVSIPLRDCAAAAGRVWVAHGRETIRSSPVVDPTRPLLREHELTISAHYGISERVGRAAEVAGRAEGSITSKPA
ncbi:MAG TPA: PRC-barrel domain-containing protein [Solirubrobacterales bacterium]|nr:PRC-barrel domain-containing protein [Solirubrobacterales bacterium]